jgi:hypothetical protein
VLIWADAGALDIAQKLRPQRASLGGGMSVILYALPSALSRRTHHLTAGVVASLALICVHWSVAIVECRDDVDDIVRASRPRPSVHDAAAWRDDQVALGVAFAEQGELALTESNVATAAQANALGFSYLILASEVVGSKRPMTHGNILYSGSSAPSYSSLTNCVTSVTLASDPSKKCAAERRRIFISAK